MLMMPWIAFGMSDYMLPMQDSPCTSRRCKYLTLLHPMGVQVDAPAVRHFAGMHSHKLSWKVSTT